MRSLITALTVLLLAGVALGSSPSPRDRSWSSKTAGVGVDAPPGWMLSTHSGSPHVLVLLLHPDGARISVTATRTGAAEARELAEQERKVMEARGFRIASSGPAARGGWELILEPPRGSERVRQIYLVRTVSTGHQAIVLTLTASTAAFAARTGGLDVALSRLRLAEPAPPESASASGGAPAPGPPANPK